MIRRSRIFVRLLPFMTVLVMLALAPAALAQDDPDEEPAEVSVPVRGMVVNNIQFDSWVFGNIGSANAGVARNKLDSLLTLSVEDLERSCGLTPVQKKKLMLAGRGDIKRFFDHVEEIRKKFEKTRNDQNQFGNVWQDIQTLQSTFQAGVFGDESIFAKSVRATLSAEQVARHEKIAQDRLMFRYQARVDLAMELLNNSVGFTEGQRQKLHKLLMTETRPPRRLGQNDYWAILYLLGMLPEDKIKPIFEDVQYQSLRRQLDQAKGLGQWLKQNGFVPDEEPGAKGAQPKAAIRGRAIMPAIPIQVID